MAANNPEEKDGTIEAEVKPCYLLKLPPELREEIYKWCLYGHQYFLGYTEDGAKEYLSEVMLNYRRGTRLRLPSLLQTSREIRNEAAPIWFKINSFYIYVEDLDARLLYEWTEYCRNLVPPPKELLHGSAYFPRMRIMVADVYKWANMLQWCKWVQQGKLGLPVDWEYTESNVLAKGALTIAHSHRGRSWEECEKSLAGLRIVLDVCYKPKQCYCTVRIE